MKRLDIPREILEESFKKGKTKKQIAEELNISVGTVSLYCRIFGIRKSSIVYNETFFDTIDTEEKAYFLGFITADGSIHLDKRKSLYGLEIGIHEKDRYILEKFRDLICPTGIIRERVYNGSRQVRITFCNHILGKSLVKLGLVPNKTYITVGSYENILDVMDISLQRHFIRGFFDGDGGFNTRVYIGPRVGKTITLRRLEISNSNTILLNKLVPMFSFMNTNCKVYIKKGICYRLIVPINNKNVRDLYSFLYNNTTVFLTRKRQNLKRFLRGCIKQIP